MTKHHVIMSLVYYVQCVTQTILSLYSSLRSHKTESFNRSLQSNPFAIFLLLLLSKRAYFVLRHHKLLFSYVNQICSHNGNAEVYQSLRCLTPAGQVGTTEPSAMLTPGSASFTMTTQVSQFFLLLCCPPRTNPFLIKTAHSAIFTFHPQYVPTK